MKFTARRYSAREELNHPEAAKHKHMITYSKLVGYFTTAKC